MLDAFALKGVRDINVASRIVEDMSGDTLADLLFERYDQN